MDGNIYQLLMTPLILVLTSIYVGCQVSESSGVLTKEAPSRDAIISAQELSKVLGNKDLVILDMGPELEIYEEGHIPGAVYIDWVDDITDAANRDRYLIADRPTFQKLLRRHGLTKDSRVVIYDDMDCRVAMRMYWSLKYYGLSNLQILDGGRDAWVSIDGQMSTETPTSKPSQIDLDKPNEKLTADLDFIADRLQNPKVVLIDGRPADQYNGSAPGKVFHTGAIHEKRCHIPGAINVFWKDNFNEDGTFKSKAELEELYSDVTGSQWIVTYCNEGLHAVPPWFVLSELLGRGNVRVYDNSLSEWANSSQPVEQSK